MERFSLSIILLFAAAIFSLLEKWKLKSSDDKIKNNLIASGIFIVAIIGACLALADGRENINKIKDNKFEAHIKDSINQSLNYKLQDKQDLIFQLQQAQNQKATYLLNYSNQILNKEGIQQRKIDSLYLANGKLAELLRLTNKEQIDLLTSAGSYCYLSPSWIGRGKVLELHLVHIGNRALNNVEITIVDSAQMLLKFVHMQIKGYNQVIKDVTTVYKLGSIYPKHNEFFLSPKCLEGQKGINLLISIKSNSGIITETIKSPYSYENDSTKVELRKDGLEIPVPIPYYGAGSP